MPRGASPRKLQEAHRTAWRWPASDRSSNPSESGASMSDGTWFDNLTRMLAGGTSVGSRRDFLRILGGSLAGALTAAVLPPDAEAAPADQATCSPRPRVVITNTPTSTGLSVTVAATGSGN